MSTSNEKITLCKSSFHTTFIPCCYCNKIIKQREFNICKKREEQNIGFAFKQICKRRNAIVSMDNNDTFDNIENSPHFVEVKTNKQLFSMRTIFCFV